MTRADSKVPNENSKTPVSSGSGCTLQDGPVGETLVETHFLDLDRFPKKIAFEIETILVVCVPPRNIRALLKFSIQEHWTFTPRFCVAF